MRTVLEYQGFKAAISIDDTADSFHGIVVGIKDTIDFFGRDIDELRREFKASIDGYVEWRREEGEEPEGSSAE